MQVLIRRRVKAPKMNTCSLLSDTLKCTLSLINVLYFFYTKTSILLTYFVTLNIRSHCNKNIYFLLFSSRRYKLHDSEIQERTRRCCTSSNGMSFSDSLPICLHYCIYWCLVQPTACGLSTTPYERLEAVMNSPHCGQVRLLHFESKIFLIYKAEKIIKDFIQCSN